MRDGAQHVAKLGDLGAAAAEFGRNAGLDEARAFNAL